MDVTGVLEVAVGPVAVGLRQLEDEPVSVAALLEVASLRLATARHTQGSAFPA